MMHPIKYPSSFHESDKIRSKVHLKHWPSIGEGTITYRMTKRKTTDSASVSLRTRHPRQSEEEEEANDDDQLETSPKNKLYLSKTPQDAIVDILAAAVCKELVSDINSSGHYSLMMDEAEEGCFGALKIDANGVKLDGQQIWNPGPEPTFWDIQKNKKDYQGPLYSPHPDLADQNE